MKIKLSEIEVELLGFTIDFKLNFKEHISNICNKTKKTKKKAFLTTKCYFIREL